MNSRFCSPGRILPYLFYFSLLYLLLWCWKPATAQSISQYKALQIGDTVPDVTIPNVLHYKTPMAKLSDFKGKLLIIDFWATWCSPCVAMIAKTDSLQQQFNGRVQFLPVAYQSRQVLTAFQEKYQRRFGKRIKHPEVFADTVLQKLFPHKAFPHYVWIGEDGVVKAITGMDQINAETLSAFLDKNQQKLTEKKDLNFRYDRKIPLLARQEIEAHPIHTHFHSSMTDYIPGITGGYYRKRDSTGFTRITLMNLSIPAIARSAFGESKIWFGNNRIDIDVKDSVLLKPVGNEAEWIQKNTYCYEIIVPKSKSNQIFTFMQQDLSRYFSQYHFYTEKRIKKCLALVRTSQPYQFSTASNRPAEMKMDISGAELVNCPVGVLVDRLNFYYQQLSAYPLVDQTGMDHGVDLKITGSLSDVKTLNKSLAAYGLAFVEKQLPIQVLVIEDANPSSTVKR
jgi:thiol-disulfide isomerase/thioredoxin